MIPVWQFLASTGLLGASEGNGEGGVRDTVSDLAQENDIIVVALLGMLTTMVAALIYLAKMYANTKVAADQSTQANQAVNNVAPGTGSISENVRHINDQVNKLIAVQEEFSQHGWSSLPTDIGDAVGLTTTIRDLQSHAKHVNGQLDTIIEELREHVAWEMAVNGKYADYTEGED